MGVRDRLQHAYNAFLNRDPIETSPYSNQGYETGSGYSNRPTRARFGISNERSIISSIYLRLAMDAASVDIRHVKLDDQDRYVQDVKSGLHNCLNIEANLDQSGRAFMQDLFMSMCESGDIAILPVDMSSSPANGGLFDVQTVRIGRVVHWYPEYVRVEAYNEKTGRHEQVTVPKRNVGLVENPMKEIMNEPNSTLQRLIRKLALLDKADEDANSGKLDMIIQLPYPIRSEGRRLDAEHRRRDIEFQMKDSQYGIAYIDATEKVTQLNRPLENNLMGQIDRLLELLYTQLGLTAGVMNGTAPESEMLNYNSRTIEPMLSAVTSELKRKFLTKTARTQGHDIQFFRDPFKLVPMKDLAELADKFTRNEIVSSNEFRGFIGMRPKTDDPKADMLINSNLPVEQSRLPGQPGAAPDSAALNDPNVIDGEVISDTADDPYADANAALDEAFKQIGVAG